MTHPAAASSSSNGDSLDISELRNANDFRRAVEAIHDSRPITEDGIKRYWPFIVTLVLVAGNYFVMSSKVDALAKATEKTQEDIKDLSKAFYEMRGAFDTRFGRDNK